MPKSLQAYIALLGTIACALLLIPGQQIRQADWPYLVVLAVLGIVFALTPLVIPPGSSFSFGSAVLANSIFIAGIPVALWVAAITAAGEGLVRGKKPSQIVYNVSQDVIAVYLAGQVFFLLGGRSGQEFDHPLPALAAGMTLMVANNLLLSRVLAWVKASSYLAVLRKLQTGQAGLIYALGQVSGLIGTYLALNASLVWLPMIVAFVLLIRYSFKNYLNLLESANVHVQELQAVLNATQSAILVRDKGGDVRHMNRRFAELTGVAESGPVEWATGALRQAHIARALLQQAAGQSPGQPVVRTVLPVDLDPIRFLDYYRGPVASEQEHAGTIEVFTDITALKEAEEKLRAAHGAMLRALTAAIDARDPYTHGHSTRVAEFSVLIARHLGLGEADVQRLHYSALLHDIGKLGVDDRVLRKHGPLTPEERALMMEHPVIGAQLLEKAGVFPEQLPGVKYHHEWYDGGGYPEGLKSESIPFEARIIGVADAFDAMTSDRPYRRALSQEEALARLHAGRGIQFDPQVVEAFTRAYQAGEVDGIRAETAPMPEPMLPDPDAAAPGDPGVIRPVHKRELSILYKVARENYSRLDLGQMLRRILEICYDTIGTHMYMIFLRDDASGELVLQANLGHSPDQAPTARWRPGHGIVGRVAETGKSLLVPDVEKSPAYGAALPATRAGCAVPLMYGGEVIGVFNVESALPGAFSREDLYLFEALAQQVASAVELARYHERLAYAASHDGLTGALNHSAFYDRLTLEVEQAKRLGHFTSLVILDLNGMKAVNDTYGHPAGDRALQEWADLLRAAVRESDCVARYGGDEFALILPEMSRRQAALVVERLVRASARSFSAAGRQIPLPRASFGVATFPEDGERATELVARADQQMYAEKGRVASRLSAGGGPRFL